MKLLLLLMFGLLCKGNLLERGYLPPPGSKIAGGSPGAIDVPLETPLEYPKNGVPSGPERGSFSGHYAGAPKSSPDDLHYAGLDNFPSSTVNAPSQASFAFTQTTTYSPLAENDCTGPHCELNQPSYISKFGGSKSDKPMKPQFPSDSNKQTSFEGQVQNFALGSTSQFSPSNIVSSTQSSLTEFNGIVSSTPINQQFINNKSNKDRIQGTLRPQTPTSQTLIPGSKLGYTPENLHNIQQNNGDNNAYSMPPSNGKIYPQIENQQSRFPQTQIRQPSPGSLPTDVLPQLTDQQPLNASFVGVSGISTERGQIILANLNSGVNELTSSNGSPRFSPTSINGTPEQIVNGDETPNMYYKPTPDDNIKMTPQSYRPHSGFEQNATILNYDNVISPEGYFSYSFDTSNGIHADESGNAADGVKANGSYSYTGDDGKLYSVTYSADENGYQPKGDHLPTPPPIPVAIQRVIEQSARDQIAGKTPDLGLYDDGKYGFKKYQGHSGRMSTVKDQTDDLRRPIYQNGLDSKGTSSRLKYLPDATPFSQSYESTTILPEKITSPKVSSDKTYGSKNQPPSAPEKVDTSYQYPKSKGRFTPVDGTASKIEKLATTITPNEYKDFQPLNDQNDLDAERRPVENKDNKTNLYISLQDHIIDSQNAIKKLEPRFEGNVISPKSQSPSKLSDHQIKSPQSVPVYKPTPENGITNSQQHIFGPSQNKDRYSSPKVQTSLSQENHNDQHIQKTSEAYPQNKLIIDNQHKEYQTRPGFSRRPTDHNNNPYSLTRVTEPSTRVHINQYTSADDQSVAAYQPVAGKQFRPNILGAKTNENALPNSVSDHKESYPQVPNSQNQEKSQEKQPGTYTSKAPIAEKRFKTIQEINKRPIGVSADDGYLVPVQIKFDDQGHKSPSSYDGVNRKLSKFIPFGGTEVNTKIFNDGVTETPNDVNRAVQTSPVSGDTRFRPSGISPRPVSTYQSGNTDVIVNPNFTHMFTLGVTDTNLAPTGTPQGQQSNGMIKSSYEPSDGYRYNSPTNRFDTQQSHYTIQPQDQKSAPGPVGSISGPTSIPSKFITVGTNYPAANSNSATMRPPIKKPGRPSPGSDELFNVHGEISVPENEISLSQIDSFNPADTFGHTSTNDPASNDPIHKTSRPDDIYSERYQPTLSPLSPSTTNRGNVKYNQPMIQRPTDHIFNQKSLSRDNNENQQHQTESKVQSSVFGLRNQPSYTIQEPNHPTRTPIDGYPAHAPIQSRYSTNYPTRDQYYTSRPTQYDDLHFTKEADLQANTVLQSTITSTSRPFSNQQNNQEQANTLKYPDSMGNSGQSRYSAKQADILNPQNNIHFGNPTTDTLFNQTAHPTSRPFQFNQQNVLQNGKYPHNLESGVTSTARPFENQHFRQTTNPKEAFGHPVTSGSIDLIQRQPSTPTPYQNPRQGGNFLKFASPIDRDGSYFQSKYTQPDLSTFKPNQDQNQKTTPQGFIRKEVTVTTGPSIYSTSMPTGLTNRQLTSYPIVPTPGQTYFEQDQGVGVRNDEEIQGIARLSSDTHAPENSPGEFPDSSKVKGETFSASRQPPRYDPETGYHY